MIATQTAFKLRAATREEKRTRKASYTLFRSRTIDDWLKAIESIKDRETRITAAKLVWWDFISKRIDKNVLALRARVDDAQSYYDRIQGCSAVFRRNAWDALTTARESLQSYKDDEQKKYDRFIDTYILPPEQEHKKATVVKALIKIGYTKDMAERRCAEQSTYSNSARTSHNMRWTKY